MHSPAIASVLASLLLLPASPLAQAPPPPGGEAAAPKAPEADEAEARRKLEEQIARELGGGARPSGAAAEKPAAVAPAQGGGGNPAARLLLLPDISAVGSFSVAYDSYDVEALSPRAGPFGPEGKPTPQLDEVELAIQSVVDPYARADIFVSFGPEEVAVEEAYLTTLGLPAGLQLRAGKLFSPFGRQNQQHPHAREFVDGSLVSARLLADEVLSGPGLDLAWLAPVPWFAELHLAGQGTAPAEEDPERLTAVARLLQYFPLGASTTLGVGLSAARRDEARGEFRDLGGVDVHLRWRPPEGRRSLSFQGELVGRRFRGNALASKMGAYAQLFLRQDAHLGYGVRWDWAPTPRDLPAGEEHRIGALLAWLPSEFQRIRLQVSYDRRPGGEDGWEGILALELGIGVHGAHPF